jgi:hypothetical protein
MTWPAKELERVGGAEEIGLASRRPGDVGSVAGPGSHPVTVRLVPNTGGE